MGSSDVFGADGEGICCVGEYCRGRLGVKRKREYETDEINETDEKDIRGCNSNFLCFSIDQNGLLIFIL